MNDFNDSADLPTKEDIQAMAQKMADKAAKKVIPKHLEGTAAIMTEEGMSVLSQAVPSVPDIATGGDRAPRLGCYISIQPVPYLDEQVQPGGPMFVPRPPIAQFIMADTYEQLLARVVFEVEHVIDVTKEQIAEMEALREENTDEFGFKIEDQPKNNLRVVTNEDE
jgi:hypothetical protein